jgi:hypothetical protein
MGATRRDFLALPLLGLAGGLVGCGTADAGPAPR